MTEYRKANDLIEKMMNKVVVVEGTDPIVIPSPQGPQTVYSPMVGTLREILEDGFVVSSLDDDKDECVVFRENLRSIRLAQKAGNLVAPKSKLIT